MKYYYQYYDSPVGILQIKCSGTQVLAIHFIDECDLGTEPLTRENELTNEVSRQLDEYFDHKRHKFDLPVLYPDSFYGKVYAELATTNIGETLSYRDLAFRVGTNASRAVGTAMRKNTYAIIVPCHRVIRSDGTMGNYFNGIENKKWLLNHEQEFNM